MINAGEITMRSKGHRIKRPISVFYRSFQALPAEVFQLQFNNGNNLQGNATTSRRAGTARPHSG